MGKGTAWTYELLVKDIYDKLLSEEGIEVFHRRELRGKRSGQMYEMDLSFEFEKVGVRFLVLIECKHYSRSVGIDDAIELAYKVDDIGAQKGILVTTHDFQKGVFSIAKAAGLALVKIFRPGEFDVNIADVGPPDYEAEYFLDYRDYIARGEPPPPVGFGLLDVLPSILDFTGESLSNRSLLIQSAVDDARRIKTDFDRAEEATLLSQAGLSPSGLIARFNLARHYHRTGRYDDAIRVYLQFLSEGIPLPKHRDHAGGNLDTPEVVYYNLACAFARKGDTESALKWLRLLKGERALLYIEYARVDSDFNSIHENPEFQELLEP